MVPGAPAGLTILPALILTAAILSGALGRCQRHNGHGELVNMHGDTCSADASTCVFILWKSSGYIPQVKKEF
jgi:hypothetical protein